MCASETTVAVTVVPMFAPMIIGTALLSGSGDSGAATSPTIIDVVTEELWTIVVARIPTTRPTSGFWVVEKITSRKSPPSSLNPSPRPLTLTRKPNSRTRTVTSRERDLGESPGGEVTEGKTMVPGPMAR